MDFPVFFRGKNPKTSKGRCEINECQIPVTMDGVTIRPGDYIFGDIDGTVIIPKEIADEVLEKGKCGQKYSAKWRNIAAGIRRKWCNIKRRNQYVKQRRSGKKSSDRYALSE